MGTLTEEELHRRCRELLRDTGVTPPLDPIELCRRVGARRGRRIRVTAADLGSTSALGHVLVTERADRILYDRSASRPQRAHVVYHELMHLVLGHLDGADGLTCGTAADPAAGPYADPREWEAETAATILSAMSSTRARPDRLVDLAGTAEGGIAAAFGISGGGAW